MHKSWSLETLVTKKLKNLHEVLIILALCANYIFAHALLFIWQMDFIYYVVIILVASFLGGVVVTNPTRSILYVTSSLVVGGLVGIGIIITPIIIYQADPTIITAVVLYHSSDLGKILLLSLPMCIIVALIGCFLGEDTESVQT